MSEKREKCPSCGLFKGNETERAHRVRKLPALMLAISLGARAHEIEGIAALLGIRPRCWWKSAELCASERAAVPKDGAA